MNPFQKIHELGQSLWYDNIQRRLLENGELAGMIERGEIRGVTSNPSIFHNAIAKSSDYDSSLIPMAWSGWSADQIFTQLAVEDIRAAADLFTPLYRDSAGGDGYVSLEVSPLLAHDTQATIAEARRLWSLVDRPNLMIKIPATRAGIPAITEVIAAGINVNVTLIFSLERYREVMDAYLRGLESRLAGGLPVGSIASVASFFVSRVDTKIDALLAEIIRQEGPRAEQAARLLGKAAIANARLAYALFQETFSSPRFQALKAQGARVQRPLWASTSTKNPAYRDVLYVEELIGPDTVNTVPPQTLAAFGDHGQVRLSLTENVDAARAQLQALADLGISMDEVTDQLEAEGVKAFADAFQALIATIEERRQAAAAELGPLQQAVAARVTQLAENDVPRRIWSRDPSLWTSDPAAQDEIRKRMGWLEAPHRSRSLLPDIARLVKELQDEGFTHALLIGMGGSSLAPEVLAAAFGPQEVYGRPGLALQVLDSTDPAQVRAAARWAPIEHTLFIVASKSGGTAEITANLDYFWARARRRLGEKAARHFVAITDPATPLEALALERKFRRVFLGDPSVGGRFSALTAFGLVPAGLIGVNALDLLVRAARMSAECAPAKPAGSNPGLVLGALLAEAALQGRDKLTFLADPPFAPLGAWLEQLIAESSGKAGQGIVPIDSEPPLAPSAYGRDRLFVYLRRDGQLDARLSGLRAAGHPAVTLSLKDAYDLGSEFFRWEFATAAACAVLGVNAFDQPDVQDSKSRTLQKIAAYRANRILDEGIPTWEGPGGRVYGWAFPGLNGARTLADVVRAFAEQARAGDYIAINAFLPRTPRVLARLQKLRAAILNATGRATTLGFGPRFLHSTGQLHKGGPNHGLFLQITQEPASDLEIPTQGLTFGALLRAQALGDLEALLARGRRAIRIHLVEGDLQDLI